MSWLFYALAVLLVALVTLALVIALAGPGERAPEKGAAGPPKALMLALGVLLPAVAGLVYLYYGSPELVVRPSVEQLTSAFDQVVEDNPEDPAAWRLYAKLNASQGNLQEAADALAKARQLSADNTADLLGEAGLRARLAGGVLAGEPARLLARALELEPANPQALLMAAEAAVQEDDHARALEHWEKVKQQLTDPELIAIIERQMAISRLRLEDS